MKNVYRVFFLLFATVMLAGLTPVIAALGKEASVTVSMTRLDPPATALVRGAEVPVAKVVFTGSGEKIEVQRLTIHLTGTGNGDDIRRAQLYNERDQFIDGARIQDKSFSFSNLGPIVIRNGETQTFTLKIEAGLAATLGETIGFRINDENSVHVESQKYDVKTVELGERLSVSPVVILAQGESSLLSVNIASDDTSGIFFAPGEETRLGSVDFSAFGEVVTITGLTLTRAGELPDSGIESVRLTDQNGTTVMGPVEVSGNEAYFSEEVVVVPGRDVKLDIIADISSAAEPGQTLFFEITSPYAVQTATGNQGSATSTASFPLRTVRKEVAGSRLEISLSANTPEPRSVGIGQSGVVLAEFELFSPVEDVTIRKLTLRKTGLMEDKHIENFRIVDLTDNTSFKADSFRDQVVIFDELPIVKMGKTKTIRVLADISTAALPNTSFGIELTGPESVEAYSEANERLPVSGRSSIGGRPVTVGEAETQNSLSVSFSNQAFDVPAGLNNAGLMRLRMKAEKDVVEVRRLRLSIMGDAGGRSVDYRLVDEYGRIVAADDSADGTITFTDPFPVTGKTTYFWLVANINSPLPSATEVRFRINNAADIEVYDIKTDRRVEATGDFPVGSYAISLNPLPERDPFLLLTRSLERGNRFSRSETGVELGTFIATAFYRDIRIERLLLLSEDNINKIVTNVGILDATGRKYSGTIADGSLIIEDPIRIPANEQRELTVVADILPGAEGGSEFALRVDSNAQILAKARGEEVDVLAAYPLTTGKSIIDTGQAGCPRTVEPVCGRTYHACALGPCEAIDSQYTNRCELENAEAYFLWEGTCSRPTNMPVNDGTGTPPGSQDGGFGDVSVHHPYHDAIASLRDEGLIQGFDDGSYRPEIEISRAAFTKIVVGAIATADEIDSCELPVRGIVFPDVPGDQWFAPYVCVAATRGIISGFPDGSFRPEKPVSFAEAAKIVALAFGAEKQNDAVWYRPYVEFMAESSAIPLTIDSLTENITRSEMAEMIWRLKEGVTDKDSRNAVEVML